MSVNNIYNLDGLVEYLNRGILIDYTEIQYIRDIRTYSKEHKIDELELSKTDESIFRYIEDIVRLDSLGVGDIVEIQPTVYKGTNNRVYYKNPPIVNLSKDSRSILYPGEDRYFVSVDVVSQEAFIILNELKSKKLQEYYSTGDFYTVLADSMGIDRSEAKSLWVRTVYGGKLETDNGRYLYNLLKEEGLFNRIDDIVEDYLKYGKLEGDLGSYTLDTYFDVGTEGGKHKLFNAYNQCMGSELMVRLVNKIEGSKRMLGLGDDDLRLEMMIHDELVFSASADLAENRLDTLLGCFKHSKDLDLKGWSELVFMLDVVDRL